MVPSLTQSTLVSILVLSLITPAHASDCTKSPTGLPYARYIASPAHDTRSAEATRTITPRNAAGAPDPAGKICVVLFGMSNARMYHDKFVGRYRKSPHRNPQIVLIQAAKPGHTAKEWANPANDAWARADARVIKQGCTPAQVQAVQFFMTQSRPDLYGVMTDTQIRAIVANAAARWPRTAIGYVSGLPSTLWSDDPALAIQDRMRAPEWSVNADSHLLASIVETGGWPFPLRFIDAWSDGENMNPMTGAIETCLRKTWDGVHPSTGGELPVNGKAWWGQFLLEQLLQDASAWGWLFR